MDEDRITQEQIRLLRHLPADPAYKLLIDRLDEDVMGLQRQLETVTNPDEALRLLWLYQGVARVVNILRNEPLMVADEISDAVGEIRDYFATPQKNAILRTLEGQREAED
jgi:hypothetical protein